MFGWRKDMKNLSEDSPSLGQNMNPRITIKAYEAGVHPMNCDTQCPDCHSLQGQRYFFSHNIHIGSGVYLGKLLENEADHSPLSVSCSTMLIVYRSSCWSGCEDFRCVSAYRSHHC
jgi:hypothetical protein